jgi:hypothetical protein
MESDEEMYMSSQGEEDEEEVDETGKGKRKARTSLGISVPENLEENVEMGMDSRDEEADTTEEMDRSTDEVIETENRASCFFRLFKHFSSAFFQRFHYLGDFLHLEEGLRQSTSVYSLCKGINLRTIVWSQMLHSIHGSVSSGRRRSTNKSSAMIR